MINNKINPLVSFGLLILAVPILLTGFMLEELYRIDFILDPVKNWHIQVIIAIIFAFVTSISLMLRWKYAILLTNILLFFITIIYSIFIYDELKDISFRKVIPISISFFIYLLILFCFLFINNEFIRQYFDDDAILKRDQNEITDILDA